MSVDLLLGIVVRADNHSIWRPLRGPVEDWPLATMDYRSCQPDLIHPTDLLDKADGYRGQTVTFGYSKEQQWYYLDGHRTDEVTLIKIWDNKADVVGKRGFPGKGTSMQ